MVITAPEAPAETVDYPALFDAADTAASQAQRRSIQMVRLDLSCVIAAATLSAIGAVASHQLSVSLAVVAAVLLMGALFAGAAVSMLQLTHTWYTSRGIAESVKSAMWTYVMQAHPFDGTDSNADARFLDQLEELLTTGSEVRGGLGTMPDDLQQITPWMRRMRALPMPERRTHYIAERLNDQARWYRAKAGENSRQASQWFWAGLIARGIALAFAILSIVEPSGASFVGLFSAVAAAATAWTQFRRHEAIGKGYGLAAEGVSMIGPRLSHAPDEESIKQHMLRAEERLLAENRAWAAGAS
jgi:SMODS and SLOG-associating 2TM effector domain 3/SMODS and SLOG-associating 2TM effector domain 1